MYVKFKFPSGCNSLELNVLQSLCSFSPNYLFFLSTLHLSEAVYPFGRLNQKPGVNFLSLSPLSYPLGCYFLSRPWIYPILSSPVPLSTGCHYHQTGPPAFRQALNLPTPNSPPATWQPEILSKIKSDLILYPFEVLKRLLNFTITL